MLTPRPLSLRLLLTCGARLAKHWDSPACSVLHLALAGRLHSQRVLPHRRPRTALVALTRQRLCRMEARSSPHGQVAVAVAAAHERHASRLRSCASATAQAWRGMHCGDQSPAVRNARLVDEVRGMPTNVRPSLSLLREESAHGRAGRPCRCASRSGAKLSAGGGARLLHAAELRGSERSFDAIPDRSYRFEIGNVVIRSCASQLVF